MDHHPATAPAPSTPKIPHTMIVHLMLETEKEKRAAELRAVLMAYAIEPFDLEGLVTCAECTAVGLRDQLHHESWCVLHGGRRGVVTAAIAPVDAGAEPSRAEIAFAFCSPTDAWNRKKGNLIARARLRQHKTVITLFAWTGQRESYTEQLGVIVRGMMPGGSTPNHLPMPIWLRTALAEGWLAVADDDDTGPVAAGRNAEREDVAAISKQVVQDRAATRTRAAKDRLMEETMRPAAAAERATGQSCAQAVTRANDDLAFGHNRPNPEMDTPPPRKG